MKKLRNIAIIGLISIITLSQTGCIGSFTVTKKLYSFNRGVGDKISQELVFLAFIILPVYEACFFIDGIVLNTIEFWTGTNPLAMKNGETDSKIVKKGNNSWLITASKNKFNIRQIAGKNKGKQIDLVYLNSDNSWNLIHNGELQKISQSSHENTNLIFPDGSFSSVNTNNYDYAIAKITAQSGSSFHNLD